MGTELTPAVAFCRSDSSEWGRTADRRQFIWPGKVEGRGTEGKKQSAKRGRVWEEMGAGGIGRSRLEECGRGRGRGRLARAASDENGTTEKRRSGPLGMTSSWRQGIRTNGSLARQRVRRRQY
jgi:hypothetical protein